MWLVQKAEIVSLANNSLRKATLPLFRRTPDDPYETGHLYHMDSDVGYAIVGRVHRVIYNLEWKDGKLIASFSKSSFESEVPVHLWKQVNADVQSLKKRIHNIHEVLWKLRATGIRLPRFLRVRGKCIVHWISEEDFELVIEREIRVKASWLHAWLDLASSWVELSTALVNNNLATIVCAYLDSQFDLLEVES